MARSAKTTVATKTPKQPKEKKVAAISHAATTSRKNIPTAEYQDAAENQEAMVPTGPVAFSRARPLIKGQTRPRDQDKDPQIIWQGVSLTLTPAQVRALIEREEESRKTGKPVTIEIGDAQLTWRGKDQQDWSDLVVNAPPLYIQEKIHPKAIIDDLVRHSRDARESETDAPSLFGDLFADFNGLNDPEARTEFYQHSQHWSNRMILGDSLQVMASLAEREALRGKVQCIYFDPPYGIKFNSNWQVSTQSRDVKDGKQTDISREPEQVKAFRDTWVDGIHSYLTYLRDRLTVARDLLTESGSIFVQIGDENVHRVRALMEETFGAENIVAQIAFSKTTSSTGDYLSSTSDYIVWFCKNKEALKYRALFKAKLVGGDGGAHYKSIIQADGSTRAPSEAELSGKTRLPETEDYFTPGDMQSAGMGRAKGEGAASWFGVSFQGREFRPTIQTRWKTNELGFSRLINASRIVAQSTALRYVRKFSDFRVFGYTNIWEDVGGASDKRYVVETSNKIVERCLLMTTDPGDLVLDPTCGSGTTAVVAEQWGRRWITIDTSRVALALARTRLMSARFAYYQLADSKEGRAKERDVSGRIQPDTPTSGDIRQGFVYERAPHITLKSIANNAEIDHIWEAAQKTLEPLRAELNAALEQSWEEWQIPREPGASWPAAAKKLHATWWEARIERQRKIDASIAKAADIEYLYDRPYADTSKVRVTGPFTVETLSPHRMVPSGTEELSDELKAMAGKRRRARLATPPPTSPPWCWSTYAPPACTRWKSATPFASIPSPAAPPSRASTSAPRPFTRKASSNAAPPS